jgi:hypothetical protein
MLMTFNPAINGWAIFSDACRVMAKRLRDVCDLLESVCASTLKQAVARLFLRVSRVAESRPPKRWI